MKSLIVPLLATASFSTFLICGMVAASTMNLGYTPHKFANINASIWTSTPTRVDPSDQSFTREPGERVVQTASSTAARPAATTPAQAQDQLPSSDVQQVAASQTPDNAAWCQARYRSYRAGDNSYQPLNGGPRQQCDAPVQSINVGMTGPTSSTVAQNADQSHAGWCEARYSSYRASDDTYQPFNASERRRCMSPVSMASNG